jgi:hypothetical protein
MAHDTERSTGMDRREKTLKEETAALKDKAAKVASVAAWLQKLDEKELDKLIELEPLIGNDSDTCERMLAPELLESAGADDEKHWRVTFVAKGK